MNGDLIIHSETPQYPDETIHKGDEINFRIIGRVIDKSSSEGL
jgi:phage repressor protein C with HTH and peptisase S24 domain|nr:MAG TPA_asm: LEXA REPRESSOR [Caudoviricetes sp.]